jgi:hypothetical protein
MKRINRRVYLSEGINLPVVLGAVSKGKPLPVDVTIGLTPELKKTLLAFCGMFAGAIIVSSIIKANKK